MSTGFELLVALIAVLAAGWAGGWILARLHGRQAAALAAAQADARAAVAAILEQKARLEAQVIAERAAHADKLKTYEDAEERLKQVFAGLSSAALNANTEQFLTVAAKKLEDLQGQGRLDLESRRNSIDELLKPMRETLGGVAKTLGAVENSRREDYGQLKEQLGRLDRETTQLVKALRTPHGRGRWGEVQLRRVVEMAGMIERCDFDEQVTVKGDGKAIRPDLLVHLPGGKTIIVDAKAPVSAYLDAVECADEAEKDAKLKQHASQVKTHVTQLSSKEYWKQFEPAPEFVVMFLPGEAFFGAALQHDPTLIEFGVEHNVIAASPLTLLALLRTVAQGWKHEALEENARQISQIGRELYERLSTVAEHLAKVGTRLDGAVEAYNDTVGSLENRLLVSARKFRDLGVDSGKEIKELEPVERATRRLQAADLVPGADAPALEAEVLSSGPKPLPE